MNKLAEPVSRDLGGAPTIEVLKLALAFAGDDPGVAARRVKSPWNAYQPLFRPAKINKCKCRFSVKFTYIDFSTSKERRSSSHQQRNTCRITGGL
jgi:hypothetical protein